MDRSLFYVSRRFVVAALLTWLVLSSSATYVQAQAKAPPPPAVQQKILGADKPIPAGELVMLELSPIESPPADWKGQQVEWKVFDGENERRIAVDRDGRVFFGAGVQSKKFLVVAAVTHLYGDGEKISRTQTVILYAVVTVEGLGPTPPDPPNPPQPPNFPDGKYKLAKWTYETVQQKVAPEKRREGARALASALNKVVQAITIGRLIKPREILQETAASVSESLSRDLASSWKEFGDVLADKLYSLYQDGSLKNAEDFKTAWEEIILGLDAIR